MNEYKRFDLDDEHYCVIAYDECTESPREWGGYEKFCIRSHRRYTFPNELNFDFDSATDESAYETDNDDNIIETIAQHELKKLEGYWIFNLDCYEHSGISFSFSGSGMQCQFDTSSKVGFIAVPKEIEGYPVTEADARERASHSLEVYNQYLNGEVYYVCIYKRFPSIEIEGRVYTTVDECIESCGDIYNLKYYGSQIPKEFEQAYLANL